MPVHRYAHLDSLRGLSAWVIIVYHATEIVVASGYLNVTGGMFFHQLIFDQLSIGMTAVTLFFCISGFVIPLSFNYQNETGKELKRFVIRRFFRLYPAFWVSIPLGYVMVHWMWNKEISSWDVLLNFTMMPDLLGAKPVMGLYWTLFVELVFYVLCAVLFLLGWLNNQNIVAILAGALLVAFALIIFVLKEGGLSFFAKIPLFLCIMLTMSLVSTAYQKKPLTPLAKLWIWTFLLGWCVAYPLMQYYVHGIEKAIIRGFGFCWGIIVFLAGLWLVKVTSSFWVWLGKISYSLYLLHPVAIYSFIWFVNTSGITFFQNMHWISYMLLVSVVSMLFGAISYQVIEKPAINYSTRLTAHLK